MNLPLGLIRASTGPVGRFALRLAMVWLLSQASTALAQAVVFPLPLDGAVADGATRTYDSPPPIDYSGGEWTGQLMPDGLIYHSYLAGVKEPRFGSTWSSENDFGAMWDVALGARVALWRYGTQGDRADGWEFDMEGVALPRLDPNGDSTPLIAVDYRFGLPITYGAGPWQFKTGYSHVSAHLGDEYIIDNPGIGATRINYVRDAIVAGIGFYLTEEVRLYGELNYAPFPEGGAEPLHLQFGVEYVAAQATCSHGAPFAAINADLRQEAGFGGNCVTQAGWAWRNCESGHLLRLGAQYFIGKSDQFEFFDRREEKIGFGLWYDF